MIADAAPFRRMGGPFVRRFGAPVTVRAPDGTVHDTGADGAPLRAILRGIDRTAFERDGFGGAVATDQAVRFVTADLPDADEGWIVIDATGQAWRMDAPRRDGRSMSVASVQPVAAP